MGITPACAGKRTQYFPACSCIWDHPRVCGEKSFGDVVALDAIGSPPRVRGKVAICPACSASSGITPACAGKRRQTRNRRKNCWDHPRVCGEKLCRILGDEFSLGSPPRVRGKVHAKDEDLQRQRITPACAGKREHPAHNRTCAGDHPRVCGEKDVEKVKEDYSRGSPPRVRGKARAPGFSSGKPRITPACAGKSLSSYSLKTSK